MMLAKKHKSITQHELCSHLRVSLFFESILALSEEHKTIEKGEKHVYTIDSVVFVFERNIFDPSSDRMKSSVYLLSIESIFLLKGNAKSALKKILEVADLLNVGITTHLNARKHINTQALQAWFAKEGFIENRYGKHNSSWFYYPKFKSQKLPYKLELPCSHNKIEYLKIDDVIDVLWGANKTSFLKKINYKNDKIFSDDSPFLITINILKSTFKFEQLEKLIYSIRNGYDYIPIIAHSIPEINDKYIYNKDLYHINMDFLNEKYPYFIGYLNFSSLFEIDYSYVFNLNKSEEINEVESFDFISKELLRLNKKINIKEYYFFIFEIFKYMLFPGLLLGFIIYLIMTYNAMNTSIFLITAMLFILSILFANSMKNKIYSIIGMQSNQNYILKSYDIVKRERDLFIFRRIFLSNNNMALILSLIFCFYIAYILPKILFFASFIDSNFQVGDNQFAIACIVFFVLGISFVFMYYIICFIIVKIFEYLSIYIGYLFSSKNSIITLKKAIMSDMESYLRKNREFNVSASHFSLNFPNEIIKRMSIIYIRKRLNF
ncbi:hypothetical protein [Fluviispira sanaruensis]|uniref:Uncharacterized protein n=1 Tax=Fluviispira sanaruensis TaxID=2493639 RepID=A0A4P2VMK3_FLUSA|nr:hypothetical protein [Fluviispira sanaruensis]BBH54636.1 hypothetical protein JCM31447_31100 [Fluviispira sanaruensis]